MLTLALHETIDASGLPATVVGSLRRDDGDFARILLSLSELYTHGLVVDWTKLLPKARCVPLPTYAFQRERFWLEAPTARAEIAPDSPNDTSFWGAVETGDLDSLIQALHVEDDAGRSALTTLLPNLSQWRRQRCEQSTIDTFRYRVVWKRLAASSREPLPGTWLLLVPAHLAEDELVLTLTRSADRARRQCDSCARAKR